MSSRPGTGCHVRPASSLRCSCAASVDHQIAGFASMATCPGPVGAGAQVAPPSRVIAFPPTPDTQATAGPALDALSDVTCEACGTSTGLQPAAAAGQVATPPRP